MWFCWTVILNRRSRIFDFHIFKLRIRSYEKTLWTKRIVLLASVFIISFKHLFFKHQHGFVHHEGIYCQVFPLLYVLWIKFILLCQQEEMLEKLKYCQLCPQSSVISLCVILWLMQLNIITTEILKVLPDQVPAVENNFLSPKNLLIIG